MYQRLVGFMGETSALLLSISLALVLAYFALQEVVSWGYEKKTREVQEEAKRAQEAKQEAYEVFRLDEQSRKTLMDEIFSEFEEKQSNDIQEITRKSKKASNWELVSGQPVGAVNPSHEFMPSDIVRILVNAENQTNAAIRSADQAP